MKGKEQLWIFIKTDFAGVHCWEDCEIKQVNFLKNMHRHKIYIEVHMAVDHCDREVEYFMLKDDVDTLITRLYGPGNLKQVGKKSMEHVCLDLKRQLDILYPKRQIKVIASEDDQVGSYII